MKSIPERYWPKPLEVSELLADCKVTANEKIESLGFDFETGEEDMGLMKFSLIRIHGMYFLFFRYLEAERIGYRIQAEVSSTRSLQESMNILLSELPLDINDFEWVRDEISLG